MHLKRSVLSRRQLLATAAAGAIWFETRGAFAQALTETPQTVEGPFYPDRLPLDTDNDLLIIDDALTPAVGEVCYLTGRVLDASGAPVRNAYVEIWQCDVHGSYLHSRGRDKTRDANFQGYGRFITGWTGEYVFRTIKPVPYTLHGLSRAPHIHVAISRNGRRVLTTQAHVNGHPNNTGDYILRTVDEVVRQTVLVDFQPMVGGSAGELSARFDVILGRTAFEGDDGRLRGGVGKSLGPGDFWEVVEAVKKGMRRGGSPR